MIAGVYNFNPYEEAEELASSTINVFDVAARYRDTYSLIRNTRRTKTLHFRIDESLKKVFVSRQKHVIEYLIAILLDNVWKYSEPNSPVIVQAKTHSNKLVDLTITNSSGFISQPERLFDRGYKADTSSEGFGFGLYWAQLLTDHYNRALKRETDLLEIEHAQKKTFNDTLMNQSFVIKNIIIE
jgi:K+-sensing histidine kinase KdpD